MKNRIGACACPGGNLCKHDHVLCVFFFRGAGVDFEKNWEIGREKDCLLMQRGKEKVVAGG